jgi:hypothetical protein
VKISVLVQADKTWIGLSRINEFIECRDLAKLESELVKQKKSAFFAERSDIDIAGELVPYGAVVQAIEAANRAGFTDWVVSSPSLLAARPAL